MAMRCFGRRRKGRVNPGLLSDELDLQKATTQATTMEREYESSLHQPEEESLGRAQNKNIIQHEASPDPEQEDTEEVKSTRRVKRKKQIEESSSEEEKKTGRKRIQEAQNIETKNKRRKGKVQQENNGKFPENPFFQAPNRMNERLFRVSNPFVTVSVVDEVGDYKFEKLADDQHMDPDVVKEATRKIMCEAARAVCGGQRYPSTELAGRHHHYALMHSFWFCTRRRKSKPKVLPPKEHFSVVINQQRPQINDGDKIEDYRVKVLEPSIFYPLSSNTSDENMVLNTEGDGRENTSASQTKTESFGAASRFDMKVKVFDKRIEGANMFGDNSEVTVLLIECDWLNNNINKMLQCATYGIQALFTNMRKGRYEPIFLQTWDAESWKFAILRGSGVIRVQNGHVKAICGKSEDLLKIEEYEQILQTHQINLSRNYNVVQYPDGEYIYGQLVVCNEKQPLLKIVPTRGQQVSKGVLHFVESIIRIIAGDRVLEWTPEDLKNIIAERDEEVTKLAELDF